MYEFMRQKGVRFCFAKNIKFLVPKYTQNVCRLLRHCASMYLGGYLILHIPSELFLEKNSENVIFPKIRKSNTSNSDMKNVEYLSVP